MLSKQSLGYLEMNNLKTKIRELHSMLVDKYDPTIQHLVSCFDWIIKGVNGEFYSCKPDIFTKTYEII